MNKWYLVSIVGIYTFSIVFTIHKYEAAIKQYKDSINDYKRALSMAKHPSSNAEHYRSICAYRLQIENKKLKETEAYWSNMYHQVIKQAADNRRELDEVNESLILQLKSLKKELIRLTPIDNESRSYVNPYNNPLGKND